jgi:hypothetical protein
MRVRQVLSVEGKIVWLRKCVTLTFRISMHMFGPLGEQIESIRDLSALLHLASQMSHLMQGV